MHDLWVYSSVILLLERSQHVFEASEMQLWVATMLFYLFIFIFIYFYTSCLRIHNVYTYTDIQPFIFICQQ